MKRAILLFCLMMLPVCIWAQNAPGVTWKKIETAHFTVIYPQQIEKDAARVSDTMEHLYPYEHKTIGSGNINRTKTTVLLFTQYADSNGISTLLPRRTEWYNAPPQTSFGGVVDWYQMLGIHEYRHLCQFDSLNTGLVFGLYCLLGETGQAIGMATVPGWYFEGDAVVTETLLSNGGRGRTPAFDAELRALILNGKRYGYYKAMLGSYVDHDPLNSPYLLGYFMNGAFRRNYSVSQMESIKHIRSWIPFIPYNFDLAMGFKTGDFPSDIYDSTMTEMKRRWKQQLEGITPTEGKSAVPVSPKNWTSNRTPRYLDDNTLAVVRSSLFDPTHIAEFSSGSSAEKLAADVYPSEKLITSGGGKIAWAETLPDIRWTMRSWSEIFIKLPGNAKPRQLTRHKRYYAPSLSSDGSLLAAVEFGEDNLCSIVILDAETGVVSQKIPSENNEFIMTPSFTPDGKNLVYCAQDSLKGKALKIRDLTSDDSKILIPYGWENFTCPVSDGKSVFYSSEYSGIDNIYAVDIESKKRYQVTSRLYGAYTPALSPDGTKLAYSDLTADGYQVTEAAVDRTKWRPLEKTPVTRVNFFAPLLSQEADGSVLLTIPETEKKHESFYSLSGSFVPHTWQPWVDTTTKDISLSLQSANYLQTLSTAVGGTYNYNEKTASGEADLFYLGAFPVFEAGGIYGNRHAVDDDGKAYSWFEKTAQAGISIPLNFSRGLTQRSLTFGTRIQYRSVSDRSDLIMFSKDKSTINTGSYMPVSYSISFVNAYLWANDIKPRWGQVLDLSYTHTPYKLDYTTSLLSAHGYFYFPGFFRRNSLYFEGGYEYTKADSWPLLSSAILFPRGYKEIRYKNFGKSSINYTLPLFYPENHPALTLYLGYIKQVYANLFFDAGYGSGSIYDAYGERATASTSGASGSSGSSILPAHTIIRSAGVEVIAEVMPFCLPVSLHIGGRYSYLFDSNAGSRNYSKEIFFMIQNPLQ